MPKSFANDGTHYERPFSWWGYQWSPAEARSLPWLVQAGSLDAQSAAFLSLAIEARRNLVIAAVPHQAGKSTLLTALLDFLPPETQPIYVRGLYERFEFVADTAPDNVYILCNEISAHLPTYLWGPGVRRLFDALQQGFRMATTMHAGSGSEVLEQLTNHPLNVPADKAVAIDLVVTLSLGYIDNHLSRRMIGVERVVAGPDGPYIESLVERVPFRAAPRSQPGRMVRALIDWSEVDDETAARNLASRTRLIERWVRQEVLEPATVRTAIAELRGAG